MAALSDYLRAESERIASTCTACGKCVTACPMASSTVRSADPSAVVQGVLNILRGQPASAAALEWVAVCTRSALCTPACTEEAIDPAFMMRLAKMRASGALGEPARIPVTQDRQFSPRVKAFARLTMTDDEQEHWL